MRVSLKSLFQHPWLSAHDLEGRAGSLRWDPVQPQTQPAAGLQDFLLNFVPDFPALLQFVPNLLPLPLPDRATQQSPGRPRLLRDRLRRGHGCVPTMTSGDLFFLQRETAVQRKDPVLCQPGHCTLV